MCSLFYRHHTLVPKAREEGRENHQRACTPKSSLASPRLRSTKCTAGKKGEAKTERARKLCKRRGGGGKLNATLFLPPLFARSLLGRPLLSSLSPARSHILLRIRVEKRAQPRRSERGPGKSASGWKGGLIAVSSRGVELAGSVPGSARIIGNRL